MTLPGARAMEWREPDNSARWLVVAAIAIAVLGLLPQFLSRLNGDSAFLLYAAGQVLDGARLYVDMLEVNPPLIVWLNLPIVAAAREFNVDVILMYRLAVAAVLVASASTSWRVLATARGEAKVEDFGRPKRDTLLMLGIVFVLFVLPRLDWGEREHLALALTLPWLLLAVRRVEGQRVPWAMALGTGLAAGLGIALKPHFVLVWLAREVAMWVGRKGGRGGQDGRSDSWMPVLVCVAYLLAAVVFTPEYFPLVRELAGPYSQFIRATVLETMFGPAPAVALSSLVVALGMRKLVWPRGGLEMGLRGSRLQATITVLLFATAAWAAVALLQLKGFRYHWYPAMALGFLLLLILARVVRGVRLSFYSRLFRAVATAVVVATVVATGWGTVRQAAMPLAPEWDSDPSIGLLLEALDGRVQPGDTLAVLSPNMASGFPLTSHLGTVWPLRLSNLWPAIVTYAPALEQGQSPELRSLASASRLERWSLDVTAEDMARSRPEWLVVFRHLPGPAGSYMSRIDLAGYLRRHPSLSVQLNSYDSLGTVGIYSVWHRVGGPAQPPVGNVQWPAPILRGGSTTAILADEQLGVGLLLVGVIAVDLVLCQAAGARTTTSQLP